MELVFQSLFLWNSLNGMASGGHLTSRTRVSILVFVEFAQRPRHGPRRGIEPGVSILVFVEFAQRPVRKAIYFSGAILHFRFQSLFLSKSLNGVPRGYRGAPARTKFAFQSLFLWNSLNGRSSARQPDESLTQRFQSLFLWNSLNGPARRRSP